jgi:Xaa-Pro aminopeptidase
MRPERRERAWRGLKKEGVGAALISTPENIRYLSGFTGGEALLLVTKGDDYLFVDSRYTTQAHDECKRLTVIETKDKIAGVAQRAEKLGARRLGFEPQHLSFSQHDQLKKTCGAVLVPLSNRCEEMRSTKDPVEIKLIKESATIASKSFLEMVRGIKVGDRERDLALQLENRIRKNGAESIPFPFIVASGTRGALPHGVATSKKIRRGELVTIDFGAVYRGYCSDETCTIVVGRPTARQNRVYQVVKEAHDKAIRRTKPGTKTSAIDSIARGVIEREGLGKYFIHGTGHGVGLSVHEEPRITQQQKYIVEEGMVFTIEPGVYVPHWGGVRIEDLVVVTRQGGEPLSCVPKELMCI